MMEPSVVCVDRAVHANAILTLLIILFAVLIILITTAITLLIWCKIFSKAGYSWAFGLLMLVPIANIIMPFFLAFADWPVQKELRRFKKQQEQGQS